ncbi:thiolase family protein [Leekyejoonella antrihumi]|uniref:Thiolase family protein n=1 Tax=Leekyejoonella antrihumi TaxID=1660198 RepID=A0A563DRU0_9MICO|nr:thiolase family protein [Leekyejoonella antrihumi]TWP32967.1 thiolase family protein [Leekyejoonella antrihumi]
MNDVAVITGCAETQYGRKPAQRDTTAVLLATAIARAVDHAGLTLSDVDGLAVASFTLRPDHAVDLAVKCGLKLRWLMEDTNGGASGINMLQHAARAVQCGDANHVVIVAGDRMTKDAFRLLVTEYNQATRDYVTPTGMLGPNPMFSLLTQRHMRAHGLGRADYGRVAVAQRRWASMNPGAVYRKPLSIQEYLAAPPVAPPIHLFDCVPPVTGADAVVVSRAPTAAGPAIRVLGVAGVINDDLQAGDGLRTGLNQVTAGLWESAGFGPDDLDVVSVYDDYPVMVLIQLAELGFAPGGDLQRVLDRIENGRLAVNTSGGQLSAGQAGAGGGMHGLVEAVRQLRGEAGKRQQQRARRAVVSGYGMVAYSHGSCSNAALLEAA